jgi:alpha-L-fucosidase
MATNMITNPVVALALVISVTAVPACAQQPHTPEPQKPVPFKPTWQSLRQYESPKWFRDAKFGIYVHWGIYSVPARGCWYGRRMYNPGSSEARSHRERFGHPSQFGYKDLIPKWTADNFDAEAWLTMIDDAGARYFVPCAVHHDGFDLWASPHPFNSARMGPQKDLLRPLMKATQRHGLRWGVTTHFARNYNFFQLGYQSDDAGPYKSVPYIKDTPYNRAFYHPPHGDTNSKYPRDPSPSWQHSWSTRVRDLIDRYELDFLYFDGALPFDSNDGLTGRNALAYFYNKGQRRHNGRHEVAMTIKTARNGHGIYKEGIATLDLERHKLDDLRDRHWQTDDTIAVHHWSYVDGMKYRSADYLIDKLVDIVSKNGNLLLSLPPKPDGTFDQQVHRILHTLGEWHRANGEAIFATRPWIRFGEGEARFTRSKDGTTLYVIFIDWPNAGRDTLTSLAAGNNVIDGDIDRITMLGANKAVDYTRDAEGLHVILPRQTNEHAVAVKVILDGKLILDDHGR